MNEATGEPEPPTIAPSLTAQLRGDSEAMLTLAGDLDRETVARLGHIVSGLYEAGARFLVLDLADVTRCDASARPFFTRLRRKLQLNQGWMLLIEPPLVLADLDPVSLEAAFAAYRKVVALPEPADPPQAPPPPAPEVA